MKSMAGLLILVGIATVAQEARKRELKDRTEIPGTIVCIGCTLEKRGGAEAQCTLHARHAQGLLAEDETLHTFVDNAKGHLVIANDKLRGKQVKILGWTYPKSNYIEVSKYQLREGDTWVAWDYCKTCGFEKGDNKDTDLCEDCRK